MCGVLELKGIDNRLGSELGLPGRYGDMPAFQIINDAHDLFLSLTSRLVGLEYGSNGEVFRSHPLWAAICMERFSLAARLSALASDAVCAAVITEEIRRLDETVDGLMTAVNADRHRS